MLRRIALASATVSGWLGMAAIPASAHANLTSCSIKNNAVLVAKHLPRKISGTFAEPLDPKHSFMQVFEGEADHGLVTESQHAVVDFRNPNHMTLALPKTMYRGKYYLLWYTRSAADGHYAAGVVYFSVK